MSLEEGEVTASLTIVLGRRPTSEEVDDVRLKCANWRDVFALIASMPEFRERHPVFEQVLADVGSYSVAQLQGDDLREAARAAVAGTLSEHVAARLYRVADSLRPIDQHLSTLPSDLHRLLSHGD